MLMGRVFAAAAVITLAATGVASASEGRDRVLIERFEEVAAFTVDCAAFGPYPFENLVVGFKRGMVTDVYDREGSLLQTEIQVYLDETDTNAVTGRSLSLTANARVVFDWIANVRTLTGVLWLGKTSDGMAFQDTGRLVTKLDTREHVFIAGPHEVFLGDGIDAMVCAALAEGQAP
jgi:hypothetical protein